MSKINYRIALSAAVLIGSAASAGAQNAPSPTDPQIAHIVTTADNIDIEAGRLALKKSRNPQVRAFANEMVRDHSAVNQQAAALARKLKIKPGDNDTSRGLMRQAKAEADKLSRLSGPSFDKEYADNEVAYHKQVNDALQNTLIPAAQNGELKSLLSTGLMMFQGHQQHAEQMAQALSTQSAK
jgi:putative membrane protein